MAQSSRVALILGSGPNVGSHVAERFAAAGYKVAVVSRSGKHPDPSTVALSIVADLVDPMAVRKVFAEVRAQLGEPSVVNYNGKDLSCSSRPLLRRYILLTSIALL